MQPNGGHWFSVQKKTCFETGHASVSAAGLEPATNGLKGHCSTIELRALINLRLHSIMCINYRQQKFLHESLDG